MSADRDLLDALLGYLGETVIDAWVEVRQLGIDAQDGFFSEFARDHDVDAKELQTLLEPPASRPNLRMAVARLAAVLIQQEDGTSSAQEG